MANMIVSREVYRRLNKLAQQEKRSLDNILNDLLDKYTDIQADMPNASNDNLETEIENAMKDLRPRLYERARRYWEQVGDKERLALSNEAFDEQFWLFDHEGIPRLKSEQGTIELPPDPLEIIAQAALQAQMSSAFTNISERSREILHTEFPEYLMQRLREQGGRTDE